MLSHKLRDLRPTRTQMKTYKDLLSQDITLDDLRSTHACSWKCRSYLFYEKLIKSTQSNQSSLKISDPTQYNLTQIMRTPDSFHTCFTGSPMEA